MDKTVLGVEEILRFLNALPTAPELLSWMVELRNALCDLFDDIDDISLAVNGHHNQSASPLAESGLWVLHTDDPARTTQVFMDEQSLAAQIRHWMSAAGIPMERYHAPIVLEYRSDNAVIGYLFLWRRIEHSPISQTTIEMMQALESFFIFLLSDYLARYRNANPASKLFFEAMDHLGNSVGLSRQEHRVLSLRLYGQSYKEIASILDLSLSTVKQHLASAYRKAGVHSQTELFAKFFAPHLGAEA
jgi:DNA-binding CsgD family transcriptional regulator